ncbi:uncharacterized protein LOC111708868 isoform X3 [Eurytemora carolleeae]|uniref:uncharacterized protein LOC111708868 isoform X3 n=1 Tax=Eurytemora carolleeae TaxID=1294199 RepID=UPI000C794F3C|nr:uncharacterized protein LOC111708868 isoform X3 [Eurytemora carolleeae]|eukprot:XP_023338331.1 uncharacterized protein LOC111708868 isoform X3 [Eurytemora affinis]
MVTKRYLAALGIIILSVLGVLIVSYLEIINMDRYLIEEEVCGVESCFVQLGSRCLRCTNPKLPRKVQKRSLTSVQPLPPTVIDQQGCQMLTHCLKQCNHGLENICSETEKRAASPPIFLDDDEPMCEDDRPRILGHAGGDPVRACENTVEATRAGLEAGMEAVHIDISISKDKIPFLWRDHDPRSLTSRLRQMGSYGVMGCRPAFNLQSVVPAHQLTWEKIQSDWFYVNTTTNLRNHNNTIVNFQDWVKGVGVDLKRIEKVWLEFRMPREFLYSSILEVWRLATTAGIQHKLFFKLNQYGKVVFDQPITLVGGIEVSIQKLSLSERNSIVYFLKEIEKGDARGDVFILNSEDEAVYTLLSENNSSSVSALYKELKAKVDPSNLDLKGINFEVKTMDSLVENVRNVINSRDKLTRDNCNPSYTQVAAWTVNNREIAHQLVCLHIDYIITDYPERVDRFADCALRLKQDNCPAFCGRIYLPVCGSDGTTYSNECMMRFHACETKEIITLVHNGSLIRQRVGNPVYEKSEGNPGNFLVPNNKEEVARRSAAALLKPAGEKTTFAENTRGVDQTKTTYIHDKEFATNTYKDLDLDTELLCDFSFCRGEQGYNPVCGKNGLTYDNQCSLLQTKCYGEQVHLDYEGSCKTTPCTENCSEMELPVCGTDRLTYRNTCCLERASCLDKDDKGDEIHVWHRGVCGDCTFICTREFRPVCGSNNKSYANLCTMEEQTCRDNTPVWWMHEGRCKGDSNKSENLPENTGNSYIKPITQSTENYQPISQSYNSATHAPSFKPFPPPLQSNPPGYQSPPLALPSQPNQPQDQPSPPPSQSNPPGYKPSPPPLQSNTLGYKPSPPPSQPNLLGYQPSPSPSQSNSPGYKPSPQIMHPIPNSSGNLPLSPSNQPLIPGYQPPIPSYQTTSSNNQLSPSSYQPTPINNQPSHSYQQTHSNYQQPASFQSIPSNNQPSSSSLKPNPINNQPSTSHQSSPSYQPNQSNIQPLSSNQPTPSNNKPSSLSYQPNPSINQPKPPSYQPNPPSHQANLPSFHQFPQPYTTTRVPGHSNTDNMKTVEKKYLQPIRPEVEEKDDIFDEFLDNFNSIID